MSTLLLFQAPLLLSKHLHLLIYYIWLISVTHILYITLIFTWKYSHIIGHLQSTLIRVSSKWRPTFLPHSLFPSSQFVLQNEVYRKLQERPAQVSVFNGRGWLTQRSCSMVLIARKADQAQGCALQAGRRDDLEEERRDEDKLLALIQYNTRP